MKNLCLVLFLLAISSFNRVPQSEEIKSSKITFKIKNAGITVDGSFSDLKAEIRFDPKDLENSKFHASVFVPSINTGIKMRDRDLQEEKYFYSEKFPRISITSSKIKESGKEQYKGTFDLTIRDVTKAVELPFVYTQKDKLRTFSGNFKIDRRDFGVGGNSMILSDDVRVFIEVTTIKK
jgi:polyisoprenoid-binding protein YceI